MKVLIHHAWLATVLAALLLNMAACQNGASPNKRNYETDSLSMAAENQVEVAAEAGDIKRTTELADSFVNQNLLSSVRADFYKAMACNRIENYPAMAEHIRKIIKAYEDGSDEDPLFYSRAAISLAGHYISMNQHEEAMNVAMPALAKFEPDPAIQPDWKGIFLSIIGACQNAAKERIEGELSIAREIQMSMVPSTFPEREGLDMYATMTPAREVGGDNKGDFLNMLPNAPIGLWPGLEYEGEEIGSIKSRPLFIYTDGLNEAEDRHQKQFGDDRMLDILRQTQFISAKQVIETMAEAVSQYRNGAEPNDDLSMMCICLKEPLSVCKM